MSPRPEERAVRLAETLDVFIEAYPRLSADALLLKPAFRELRDDFERALSDLAATLGVDDRRASCAPHSTAAR